MPAMVKVHQGRPQDGGQAGEMSLLSSSEHESGRTALDLSNLERLFGQRHGGMNFNVDSNGNARRASPASPNAVARAAEVGVTPGNLTARLPFSNAVDGGAVGGGGGRSWGDSTLKKRVGDWANYSPYVPVTNSSSSNVGMYNDSTSFASSQAETIASSGAGHNLVLANRRASDSMCLPNNFGSGSVQVGSKSVLGIFDQRSSYSCTPLTTWLGNNNGEDDDDLELLLLDPIPLVHRGVGEEDEFSSFIDKMIQDPTMRKTFDAVRHLLLHDVHDA